MPAAWVYLRSRAFRLAFSPRTEIFPCCLAAASRKESFKRGIQRGLLKPPLTLSAYFCRLEHPAAIFRLRDAGGSRGNAIPPWYQPDKLKFTAQKRRQKCRLYCYFFILSLTLLTILHKMIVMTMSGSVFPTMISACISSRYMMKPASHTIRF